MSKNKEKVAHCIICNHVVAKADTNKEFKIKVRCTNCKRDQVVIGRMELNLSVEAEL